VGEDYLWSTTAVCVGDYPEQTACAPHPLPSRQVDAPGQGWYTSRRGTTLRQAQGRAEQGSPGPEQRWDPLPPVPGGCPHTGGRGAAELRYKSWGETRYTDGTTPTPYRFTGQREEATIGLYFYNARWHDPALGRFVQPDSLVPDPGNSQALNRYSYVYNNPLRFVDPSGYDPFATEEWQNWVTAHCNGRDPTDADRQRYLYSLLYVGPVSGSRTWTDEDWAMFEADTPGVMAIPGTDRQSEGDFERALADLAGYYEDTEGAQYVSAIALLYAGVPYQPGDFWAALGHGFGGAVRLPILNHGMNGFNPLYYNLGEENTHHYAGHLLGGYYVRSLVNTIGTNVRELAQGLRVRILPWPPVIRLSPDWADIFLGEIAGKHGDMLARGVPPRFLSAIVHGSLR